MLVACIWAPVGWADERLWMEALVNGRPARLIFDTGTDRVILFREGARRLGLQVTQDAPAPKPDSGEAAVGITEPCDLTFYGTTVRTALNVLEMPDYLHMRADGAVGWGALRGNIICIDANSLTVTFLSEMPREALSWRQFGIRTNSGFLFLKVDAGEPSNGVVLVDTGFSGGVALAPPNWREWKAAHPRQLATLDSYFMPGAGLVITEEMLARELGLGSLSLTDVPVTEANPAQVALGGKRYQASLGLTALKRLDLIVDGEHGVAYLRPTRVPASNYDYNRTGAVFVPPDADSEQLTAHVAVPSPASEAGIRDGDVLLKIDDLDVTKWRTRAGILPLSRFWARPAGTRLDLTLKRKGALYRTTVVLRDFLRGDDKLT
jgi:hypothetical protein